MRRCARVRSTRRSIRCGCALRSPMSLRCKKSWISMCWCTVSDMQQRARCRHRQRPAAAQQRAQRGERRIEIGAPDVAPIDHTGHHKFARQLRNRSQQVGSGHQIHREPLHPGRSQRGKRITQTAEIGRQQDRRTVLQCRQLVVGTFSGRDLLRRTVGQQACRPTSRPPRALSMPTATPSSPISTIRPKPTWPAGTR